MKCFILVWCFIVLLVSNAQSNPGPVYVVHSTPEMRLLPLDMMAENVTLLLGEENSMISGTFEFSPLLGYNFSDMDSFEVRVPVVVKKGEPRENLKMELTLAERTFAQPTDFEVNASLSAVVEAFEGYEVLDFVYRTKAYREDKVLNMSLRYRQTYLEKDGRRYFLYMPVFSAQSRSLRKNTENYILSIISEEGVDAEVYNACQIDQETQSARLSLADGEVVKGYLVDDD